MAYEPQVSSSVSFMFFNGPRVQRRAMPATEKSRASAAKPVSDILTPVQELSTTNFGILHRSIQQLLRDTSTVAEAAQDYDTPVSLRGAPQLDQEQEVTTPPDGLCLAYACVASFQAEEWRSCHNHSGYRHDGNVERIRAEKSMAEQWLGMVTSLMLAYASARGEFMLPPGGAGCILAEPDYKDRAAKLLQRGAEYPELLDVPFYAFCLGGRIEVLPLDYADYQHSHVVGEGHLCCKVGNLQVGEFGGNYSGHFILLQSWMPRKESLFDCIPALFTGVHNANQTSDNSMIGTTCEPCAVGSEQGLTDMLQQFPESPEKTLLTDHVEKLTAWQHRPSNANRDAMG
eukprot:10859326-Karenia_brevis.AAC.1